MDFKKNIILGTAGHIDHGKTAFVRALSGIECDRLQEEKSRGITIVLGYAHMLLPSGIKVGIVDVPGHERFVSRMVAGATGIDVVALVIAADEGIKPQTQEHLYICEILGIKKGIVVLNKMDLADEELILLQKEDIERFLTGTFLAGATIIPVSSLTGEGLQEFKMALDGIASDIVVKPKENTFRLPIDAVISITGFGTVVRGTVLSGCIASGETCVVMPTGQKSRIRGLQNHGQTVEKGSAGERLAINLPDISKEDIERGMTVVRPGTFRASERFLAEFHYLSYNKKPLKSPFFGQCHLLAAKVNAEIQLWPDAQLPPGGRTFAVVKTSQPVIVACEDRFVVRGYGPFTTIGGGRVLHPALPKGYRKHLTDDYLLTLSSGATVEKILLFVKENGESGVSLPHLCSVLNEAESKMLKAIASLKKSATLYEDHAQHLFHREPVFALQQRIRELLDEWHVRNPLRMGIGKEELFRKNDVAPRFFQMVLAMMTENGQVEVMGDLVKKKGFGIAGESDAGLTLTHVENALRDAGLKTEGPVELAKKMGMELKKVQAALDLLTRSGKIVRINEDYYLHRDWIEHIHVSLRSFFKNHDRLMPTDMREQFGLSRKYIIPLLEYLDGTKFTARTLEGRKLLNTDGP